MTELVKGRPKNEEGRLPREIRCYDFLDSLGISYERIDHEALYTMEACRDAEKILNCTVAKNIFLTNKRRDAFYLLMLSGDKKFRTSEVSKMIGSTRLEFADESYMLELLDILPGSVSIMGLMNDTSGRVNLLVDSELFGGEKFACHPCVNTSSLRIDTKDVFERFVPATGHSYKVLDLLNLTVIG